MKKLLASFTIFLTVCLVTFAAPFASGRPGTKPSKDATVRMHSSFPWKELYFQGGKGFTRVAATLRLRPSSDFCPPGVHGIISGFMPCPLEDAGIQVLSAETAITNLIPPQEEYIQHTWFRRKDVGAIQRLRHKKGSHPWLKAYRWEANGVSRLKIQPGEPWQINKECSHWTKKHRSFFSYSKGHESCRTVSEPTLLFYLLSAMDYKKNDFPMEVCVFGKKELHLLTIRMMRLKPIKISFESYGLPGEKRIEKTVRPLVYFISESPGHEKDHEPFSLLGLQEEIYIFVDPATRLPVRIIGKTKRLGDMVLALTGAWLRR